MVKYTPEQLGNALKALQDIKQCDKDYGDIAGYLTWISAGCALTFTLTRLTNPTLRQFPDNLITIYGLQSFLWNANLGLTFLTEKRIMTPDFKGLCVLQGMLFQLVGMSCIISWFIILLIMYQIIVRQQSMSTLRETANYYYFANWSIPVVTTVGLWATDNFGPLPAAMVCFVPTEKILLRFCVLYCFYPICFFGAIYFVVRMIMILQGAGWSRAADEHCRLVSKTYITQVLGFTVYHWWFMIVAWVYGFNSMIFEYWPEHLDYVAKTSYNYCSATAISLALIGTIITIVFGFNVASCRSATRKAKKAFTSTVSKRSTGPSRPDGDRDMESGELVTKYPITAIPDEDGEDDDRSTEGELSTPSSMIPKSQSQFGDDEVHGEDSYVGFISPAPDSSGGAAVQTPPSHRGSLASLKSTEGTRDKDKSRRRNASAADRRVIISYARESLGREKLFVTPKRLDELVDSCLGHRSSVLKLTPVETVAYRLIQDSIARYEAGQ